MDYRRFGDTVVMRIDRGEEILSQLKAMALAENIRLASVRALGAVGDFTVGVFKTGEKKYYANHFTGDFEIVSLTGTISTMRPTLKQDSVSATLGDRKRSLSLVGQDPTLLQGEYYAHLHMSAGDEKGHVFGGHLNEAIVSATCEMVVEIIDGQVDRAFSEEIGLNLFRFD